MSKIDINNGEKKIMNNNPTVASVNFINDVIGGEEGSKSLGFKVMVWVVIVIMALLGGLMIISGKIIAGVILVVIDAILFITSLGLKFKSSKYKVNKEIVDNIEPLFKD